VNRLYQSPQPIRMEKAMISFSYLFSFFFIESRNLFPKLPCSRAGCKMGEAVGIHRHHFSCSRGDPINFMETSFALA
jgi:hypothetical protein